MIENPSNLTQQLLNLVERVAVEIRAIYNKLQTAVFKVNGQIPDSEGNIQIDAVTKATQDASGNVITSTYATKTELSGKANSSHTHTISDVTNLQSSLNAKLATSTYNTDKATFATKSELNAIDVGVTSVNGQTGDVTIEAGGLSPNGGTFTGTTVIYPATDTEEAVTGTVFNTADNKSVIRIGSATELEDAEGTPIGGQLGLFGSEQGGTATLLSGSPDGIAGLIADPATGFQLIAIGENGYTSFEIPLNKVPSCLAGNLVTSVNGVKADDYGNVTVSVGSDYTLPVATSSTLGGVTIGSNISVSNGKISLTKSNVTNALGYTPPTTNTTYGSATTSTAGLMSAADKKKLDGIDEGANKYTYTLPTASSSTLGGVKTTSTVTSTSGLTACPIISGVPYYKDTNTTYTLSSFGVTATSAELNYCDGVTSNIQTQLNNKLSTTDTAAKATADASGNNIANTYFKKSEITSSTTDLTAGSSALTTGSIYLVYE